MNLIEPTRQFLTSLRQDALRPFLDAWPVAKDLRPVLPSTLPVARCLDQAQTASSNFTAALVDEIVRTAPSMAWRQTYKSGDIDPSFMDNYGWSEIMGLSGPLASERVACGILLLGPETTYPRHRHEAEEIYVPLAGTASWQQSDEPWEDKLPGALIHHASNEPHAMRTKAQPLLAVYLWRSENLNQKARFDPAS